MSFSYVYLASQSPRRRELLTQLGVSYELLLADASEDVERLEHRIGRESPRHYVQRVTTLKAGAALIRRQQWEARSLANLRVPNKRVNF
jgi:septum formation protein